MIGLALHPAVHGRELAIVATVMVVSAVWTAVCAVLYVREALRQSAQGMSDEE